MSCQSSEYHVHRQRGGNRRDDVRQKFKFQRMTCDPPPPLNIIGFPRSHKAPTSPSHTHGKASILMATRTRTNLAAFAVVAILIISLGMRRGSDSLILIDDDKHLRLSGPKCEIHPDKIAHCVPPSPRIRFARFDRNEKEIRPPTTTNANRTSCTPETMRIVTVAGMDGNYLDKALNLVGSVHKNEPSAKITIYLAGDVMKHTTRIAEKFGNAEGVELRLIPLASLPLHFSRLSTYAFKPYVVWDAIRAYSDGRTNCILYQDSAQEVRRGLAPVIEVMNRRGAYFSSSGWEFPNVYTHPKHLSFFLGAGDVDDGSNNNVSLKQRFPEMQANNFGFPLLPPLAPDASLITPLASRLFLPWLACAFRTECISPPGTDRTNSRQDQTVMNIIARLRRWPGEASAAAAASGGGEIESVEAKAVTTIPVEPYSTRFSEWKMDNPSPDNYDHDVVLFSHRDNAEYAYQRYVRRRSSSGPLGGNFPKDYVVYRGE